MSAAYDSRRDCRSERYASAGEQPVGRTTSTLASFSNHPRPCLSRNSCANISGDARHQRHRSRRRSDAGACRCRHPRRADEEFAADCPQTWERAWPSARTHLSHKHGTPIGRQLAGHLRSRFPISAPSKKAADRDGDIVAIGQSAATTTAIAAHRHCGLRGGGLHVRRDRAGLLRLETSILATSGFHWSISAGRPLPAAYGPA